MKAITYNENGSWMVIAICKTFENLNEDVNVLEIFRLVKAKVSEMRGRENECQMPQSYVFPHDETTFCKR